MAERELAKEKAARLLKKRGSVSTINSEAIHKAGQRKYQGYATQFIVHIHFIILPCI